MRVSVRPLFLTILVLNQDHSPHSLLLEKPQNNVSVVFVLGIEKIENEQFLVEIQSLVAFTQIAQNLEIVLQIEIIH